MAPATDAVGALGAVSLLVFRHPRVPWWLPVTGLVLQAWVSRLGTHWIRITCLTVYAAVVLATLVVATVRSPRTAIA